MITYVDTSSLIKLLIEEPGSENAEAIWYDAPHRVALNLIEVEAHAALAAATRQRRLTQGEHRRAKDLLRDLLGDIDRLAVTAELIVEASHYAENDALRSYDAMHLAGSLVVGADVMSSADTDLCAAAARHGLAVANPLNASSH